MNVINPKELIQIKKEIEKNFNIDISKYDFITINCWGRDIYGPDIGDLFYLKFIPGINSSMLYVVQKCNCSHIEPEDRWPQKRNGNSCGAHKINIFTNKQEGICWTRGEWMIPGWLLKKKEK